MFFCGCRCRYTNLEHIAQDLNLNIADMVLVDDSPAECLRAIELSNGNGLMVIHLPSDHLAHTIPAFMKHHWCFDQPLCQGKRRNKGNGDGGESNERSGTKEGSGSGRKAETRTATAATTATATVMATGPSCRASGTNRALSFGRTARSRAPCRT